MEWLTSLPAGVLVVISLVLTILLAAGSRVLTLWIVPADERDQVQSVAAPLMPALGAAFAVLTALTLASEAGYLRSAQDIVATEAASASRLAWAATSPQVDTEPIHDALTAYLVATRAEEWRDVGSSTAASPRTSAALAEMERVVRTEAARAELGTPSSTELLASLDAVTTTRRARIAAASRQIPVVYVITLIAGGAALVMNAGALAFRSSLRTSVLVLGLSLVVALSMALLFALSAPWDGPLVVSGTPMDAVITDLRAGFFHA